MQCGGFILLFKTQTLRVKALIKPSPGFPGEEDLIAGLVRVFKVSCIPDDDFLGPGDSVIDAELSGGWNGWVKSGATDQCRLTHEPG
jgi:hypothetical protein